MSIERFVQLVQEQMEPTLLPQAVLYWFRENDGKKINKTNLAKLGEHLKPVMGAEEFDVRLSTSYGMASLIVRVKTEQGWKDRWDFYLSSETKFLTYNVNELLERNKRHYEAAEQRNSKRQAVLDNHLPTVAKVLEKCEEFNRIARELNGLLCQHDELAEVERIIHSNFIRNALKE